MKRSLSLDKRFTYPDTYLYRNMRPQGEPHLWVAIYEVLEESNQVQLEAICNMSRQEAEYETEERLGLRWSKAT